MERNELRRLDGKDSPFSNKDAPYCSQFFHPRNLALPRQQSGEAAHTALIAQPLTTDMKTRLTMPYN